MVVTPPVRGIEAEKVVPPSTPAVSFATTVEFATAVDCEGTVEVVALATTSRGAVAELEAVIAGAVTEVVFKFSEAFDIAVGSTLLNVADVIVPVAFVGGVEAVPFATDVVAFEEAERPELGAAVPVAKPVEAVALARGEVAFERAEKPELGAAVPVAKPVEAVALAIGDVVLASAEKPELGAAVPVANPVEAVALAIGEVVFEKAEKPELGAAVPVAFFKGTETVALARGEVAFERTGRPELGAAVPVAAKAAEVALAATGNLGVAVTTALCVCTPTVPFSVQSVVKVVYFVSA